ncbi:Conserved_hypothetical protein [Hexamita inflata]|uniref:Uncharacterized protein n=1 Tax=Hexamita inflata TaxID=28002 RepID=A0AA86PZ94_9EUKA|nr:Conserved hypothetical protein [Hexamita inflata]
MTESSSNLDSKHYEFISLTSPNQPKFSNFKHPEYKNIQVQNIIVLTILYICSQIISQYCSSISKNVINANYMLDTNQFYLLYNGVLCVVCVFVNVFLELKSEIDLFKISCTSTMVQSQAIVCAIAFYGLQQQNWATAYAVIATILGGCGYIIAKLACFSYMFKCLPKNADSGIIFAIFNSFHICLQVLDTILTQLDFFNIYIMYGCAAALIILFFCYDKFLKVPSFDQVELRVQDIIINNKPVQYTDIDQGEPQKHNKIYNWLRFYAFMIFRSVNGVLIVIMFALCSFNNYIGRSYLHEFKTEFTSEYYKILKQSWKFPMIKAAEVIFNIISSFCIGIYYDCLNEQNKMKKLLSIMNIVIFVELICLSIPNITDLSSKFFRISFLVIITLIYGLQMMNAMICSFAMFKGSMRMVVCFMFGVKYFVSAVQLTIEIYYDFFSQSYFVLIIFCISYLSYAMVMYKLKSE